MDILFFLVFGFYVSYIIFRLVKSFKIKSDTALAFCGTMGSGKTYLATLYCVRWYRTQLRRNWWYKYFFLIRPFFPGWRIVPSVYSNIPLRLKGWRHPVYSCPLLAEHILLEEELPQGATVLIDECGQFFSQWEFDNPLVSVQAEAFVRFCRQFFCRDVGHIVLTDQAVSNICKPIRERLGMIYQLQGFARCLFFRWGTTSVVPLLNVQDTATSLITSSDTIPYLFFRLPYKWEFWRRSYSSYCYAPIYREGGSYVPLEVTRHLTTRYMLDISVDKAVISDYKSNKRKYRKVLYMPMDARRQHRDDTTISGKSFTNSRQ